MHPVFSQSSYDSIFSPDLFHNPSDFLFNHWYAGDQDFESGYPALIVINADKTANVDGLNCSWSYFHRDRNDLKYSNIESAINEITVKCPGFEEFYVRERTDLRDDEIIEIIFHRVKYEKSLVNGEEVILLTYKLHQYYTQKGLELLKERKQRAREPTKKWGGNSHKN